MADAQGTAASTATGDNFCAPENKAFYDSAPYQPLDNEAREVRIVALRPAQSSHEQLELRLKDKVPLASLDERTIAVSYAAGDHARTEIIRVSAGDKVSDFNAFATLARALRAIRTLQHSLAPTSDAECYVWADQICINQSDPTERAYQVNHMREIYQAAGITIVYLGEDDHDGRALAYIETVFDYGCQENKRVGDVIDEKQARRVLDKVAERILDHVRSPDGAEDWWAVSALLKTPWWTRGWICQEAIVPAGVTVLYGSSTMDLDRFGAAIAAFTRAFHLLIDKAAKALGGSPGATADELLFDLALGVPPVFFADFILTARREWHSRGCVPFDDVKYILRHARKCMTGDPRDRVYAFIGLADPAYNIQADYKVPTEEAFINAAACIIKKERSLDVVFEAMDERKMLNLPSWVPDWTSPSEKRQPLPEGGYSASGGHPAQVEIAFPRASSVSCGHVLRIQVRCLDRLLDPLSWEVAEDFFATVSDSGGLGLVSEAEIASFKERAQRSERTMEVSEESPFYFVAEGSYFLYTVPKPRRGDYLCVSLGASVPMVLRREGEYFRFIGKAYVFGLMRGEAMELWGRGLFPFQTVDIV